MNLHMLREISHTSYSFRCIGNFTQLLAKVKKANAAFESGLYETKIDRL